MQHIKDQIRATILTGAESLFLKKGFCNTTMRDIASASGVGLSNIYNYFSSKDAIFRAIVNPVVEKMEKMLYNHHGKDGHDIGDLYRDDYLESVISEYAGLLKSDRRQMELLLFHAGGSSFENYKEEFCDLSTAVVKEYISDMKQRYHHLNVELSDFYIRLRCVWMFGLFEEILLRKIRGRDVDKIMREYITSEIFGLSELVRI